MCTVARRRSTPARPGRSGARADAIAGVSLLGAGAAVTVAVVLPRGRAVVQQVDERWYRFVQQHRHAALDRVSRALDVALGTTVDWTIRVGVTGLLVRQRRWRALASWATTIALGEVSIGPVKARIDRPRPLEPLTRTSMMSYPSGHAIAAATTCPGIVLAMLPAGPRRERWLDGAVAVAATTALSRTYVNAHWLSDTVGGFCLGTGFSLLVPRAVDWIADSVVSAGARPNRPAAVRLGVAVTPRC
jgi:membrane-associated phospholipid phosphatase